MKVVQVVSAAVLLCAVLRVEAALITFEGLADGAPIATVGDATFSGAVALTAGQSLNEFEVPPKSGDTVAANDAAQIVLSFSQGLGSVSGFLTYSEPVLVEALNAGSIVLASYASAYSSNFALSGDAGSSPNEAFSFSSQALIYFLRLSTANAYSFALDDVAYTFGSVTPPPPPPPTSVPEPSAAMLAITGLLAMLARRRLWVRRAGLAAALTATTAVHAQIALDTPWAYPQLVPPATPVSVTVSLRIDDTSFIAGSAVLNELNDNNTVRRRLGTLTDDGLNGDEVAGDRIFTTRFVINEAAPRQLRVGASVATIGVLTRSQSPSIVLNVASDADLRTGVAVVQTEAIVFRDTVGRPVATLPLASYAESQTVSPQGLVVNTELDIAFGSESQKRAGVVTQRRSHLASADEGASAPSTFRYFGPSGVLLFSTNSQSERTFFVDVERRHLSRSGHRVLLVEVGEHETDPALALHDESGNVVVSYPVALVADMKALRSAQLSSNGRYVGLIGLNALDNTSKTLVMVIDTANNTIVRRTFDTLTIPAINLYENAAGSFNIYLGLIAGEQLP